MSKRIIFDTDIAGDVDDIFALALALASPELDIAGITIVSGVLKHRAKVTLKLLEAVGRLDIPVFLGQSEPVTIGLDTYWGGNEGHGLDLSDVDESLIRPESANSFFLNELTDQPGGIAGVSIGPMTNFGVLARECPEAYSTFESLWIMGGNYLGLDNRSSFAEYNFKCDPAAVKLSLDIPLPTKMAGLNVTNQTKITHEQMDNLEKIGTKTAKILADAGRHYMGLRGRDFSEMHDPLLIASMVDEKVLDWKKCVPRVQTEGDEAGVITFSEPKDSQHTVDVARDIDVNRFEKLFWERINHLSETSS